MDPLKEILNRVDQRLQLRWSAFALVTERQHVHSHGREDPEGLECRVEEATQAQRCVLNSEFVCQVRSSCHLEISVERFLEIPLLNRCSLLGVNLGSAVVACANAVCVVCASRVREGRRVSSAAASLVVNVCRALRWRPRERAVVRRKRASLRRRPGSRAWH